MAFKFLLTFTITLLLSAGYYGAGNNVGRFFDKVWSLSIAGVVISSIALIMEFLGQL